MIINKVLINIARCITYQDSTSVYRITREHETQGKTQKRPLSFSLNPNSYAKTPEEEEEARKTNRFLRRLDDAAKRTNKKVTREGKKIVRQELHI